MSKINMKTTLKTKENLINYDVIAIKNGKHFSYLENGYKVVIDIQIDCVKMVRKNNEYELNFIFNSNGDSKCLVKMGERTMSIPVNNKKIEIKESYILIVYEIENESFQYLIQY